MHGAIWIPKSYLQGWTQYPFAKLESLAETPPRLYRSGGSRRPTEGPPILPDSGTGRSAFVSGSVWVHVLGGASHTDWATTKAPLRNLLQTLLKLRFRALPAQQAGGKRALTPLARRHNKNPKQRAGQFKMTIIIPCRRSDDDPHPSEDDDHHPLPAPSVLPTAAQGHPRLVHNWLLNPKP